MKAPEMLLSSVCKQSYPGVFRQFRGESKMTSASDIKVESSICRHVVVLNEAAIQSHAKRPSLAWGESIQRICWINIELWWVEVAESILNCKGKYCNGVMKPYFFPPPVNYSLMWGKISDIPMNCSCYEIFTQTYVWSHSLQYSYNIFLWHNLDLIMLSHNL